LGDAVNVVTTAKEVEEILTGADPTTQASAEAQLRIKALAAECRECEYDNPEQTAKEEWFLEMLRAWKREHRPDHTDLYRAARFLREFAAKLKAAGGDPSRFEFMARVNERLADRFREHVEVLLEKLGAMDEAEREEGA